MTPQVYVDGTRVGALAPVSDLVIAHEWPAAGVGGPVGASFGLLLPPVKRPSWLVQGAPAEVWCGNRMLAGKLEEPDLAEGRLSILGAAREGSGFPCVADGTWVPTSTPDTAIDAAISLGGVSWSRPASISTTALTDGDETAQLNSVTDMLAAYADTSGDRLYVDPHRRILKGTDPTVPEVVVLPGGDELGWTLDKQATRVVGRWANAAGVLATAVVGTGSLVRMVDLTTRGPLTEAAALEILSNILARSSSGGWTGGVTIASSQIVGNLHLADVAGRVGRGLMVRLLGQRDSRPDRLPVGYVDFVVERSEWNAADGTITLTPRGMVARDFNAVLAEYGVEEATWQGAPAA